MKRSEIRIKMSNLERGEKAHNWKGGVSYLDKVIRQVSISNYGVKVFLKR